MKINYILMSLLLLFCSFSSCNKSDDKPGFVDKYFQVEQFTVDGADSTLVVRSKPNYAAIYFVNDTRRSIIANGINYVGSGGSFGMWSLYGDKIQITVNGSQNANEDALGPYWRVGDVTWTIISQDRSRLHLETDYESKHYVYKLSVF